MSKRRGLSLEEKREKMHEFILESKQVWTVKELEKVLPKKCGIVSQSVKEVLEGLDADGLVSNDKVGIKQLYWSFPSDSLVKLETKFTTLDAGNEAKRRRIEELDVEEKELRESRNDTEERVANLATLADRESENMKLKEEYSLLVKYDPDVIAEKELKIKTATEALNRWTDNVFTVRSYCENKFNIDPQMLSKKFGIAEDMDYWNVK